MRLKAQAMLVVRAAWELAAYDVTTVLFGFRGIERRVQRVACRDCGNKPETEVCEALRWAASLYWKPVQCLQWAVVTALLLRRYCTQQAEIVIGYRPAPFFSHAWVEIKGRVLNDSPAYQKQLHVLTRM
jgi:hypothetical protein